jgi:hypothetical protein
MSQQPLSLQPELSGPLDLRSAERFPGDPQCFCQVNDSSRNGPNTGVVWDISAAGIGFVLDRRLEPGAVVELEMTNPQRAFSCRVLVRVIHSDIQFPNDAWLHGGFFLREFGANELECLRL